MAEIETDAEMRKIISQYLITGNQEAFVQSVNQRYEQIRGLKRWQ